MAGPDEECSLQAIASCTPKNTRKRHKHLSPLITTRHHCHRFHHYLHRTAAAKEEREMEKRCIERRGKEKENAEKNLF